MRIVADENVSDAVVNAVRSRASSQKGHVVGL